MLQKIIKNTGEDLRIAGRGGQTVGIHTAEAEKTAESLGV